MEGGHGGHGHTERLIAVLPRTSRRVAGHAATGGVLASFVAQQGVARQDLTVGNQDVWLLVAMDKGSAALAYMAEVAYAAGPALLGQNKKHCAA